MKPQTKVLSLLTLCVLLNQCAPTGEDSISSTAQKSQESQPTTQPLPPTTPAPPPSDPSPPPPDEPTPPPPTQTTGDVFLNCLENTAENNADDLGTKIQTLEDVSSPPSCQNTSVKVNIQPINNQTGHRIAANPVLTFNPAWGYGKAQKLDPSNPTSACKWQPWVIEFWMVRERQGQKIMLSQIWGRDLSMTMPYQNVDLQQGDDIVFYAIDRTNLLGLDQCNVDPKNSTAVNNALNSITPSPETSLLNLTTGYKIFSLKLNFQ